MNKKPKYLGKCLDTNIFISLEKDETLIKDFFNPTENYYLTVIVKAELFTGYKKFNDLEQYNYFNKIIEILNIKIITISEKTIPFYTQIF